LNKNKLFVR